MTDQEVLTKAIDIAVKNGWKPQNFVTTQFTIGENFEVWPPPEKETYDYSFESVFFDHDFARALWGSAHKNYQVANRKDWGYAWEFHLWRMVLATDRIQYLKENLPK